MLFSWHQSQTIVLMSPLFLPLLHPLTFSCQTALTTPPPSVCTERCRRPRTPTSTLHTSPPPPPPPPPCPRPPISPSLPRGRGPARASANRESPRLSALQRSERSPHPESRPGRFDPHSSMMSSSPPAFSFSFSLFHPFILFDALISSEFSCS